MLRKALIFIGLTLPLLLGAQVSKEHEDLLKEANTLFEESSYVTAHPLFSQLVSLYPKNSDFNFKFGACALYNGDKKETAIKHLTYATKKGADPRSFYHLGRAYHLNYEFKAAKEAYQDFSRKIDPKIAKEYDTERQIAMCDFGATLLSSMTDLVVMDKQETSEQDFFRYFNMDNVGGKILAAPEELQTKLDKKRNHQSIIHFPGDKSIIYFSSYGKDGSNGLDLYQATRLADGSFTDVKPIRGYVNTPYDEDFVYMHPDGKTLYFASKGHNSMGGYDIFKSTIDGATGEFSFPQNMDFAINTPDDDIFYIADSLNNSAWFASGRSSAQGNLHVYNVLVKGIPSTLIYLDGMFISEVDPDIQKARIIITDELTDRPVGEIFSDSFSGGYLLSVPKAGMYKFAVQAEGSPIRHEGIVEIPVFEESVALRQELRLIDVDGQEKLVIQNFFDEPLDMDLAVLAQETLRNKAALDVNATEELIAEAQALGDDSPALTIEKDLENAPLAAGFAEGTTIDDVLAQGREDVADIQEEIQKIEDNADLAYSYAENLHKKADQKLNAAEARMVGVDDSDMPAYIEALRDYNQLVKEAEALSEEAYVALETADRAVDYAQREKLRADDLSANYDKIENAAANDDFDTAVEGMRAEKDRLNIKGTDEGRDPKGDALALAEMKEDEEQRILQRVSQLREDERLLINDERRLTKSLEKTTKKSARAKIENELAQVREELTITQQNIINEDSKATSLGESEELFKRQAEFYDLLVGDNQQFGLSDDKIKSYDSGDKELLAADIDGTQTRVDILTIEDEETLALIGEESRATRNDISRLASIQAKALEQKIDLKSMSAIWQEYESQLLTSSDMDPTTSVYREKILAEKTVDKIDEHLALYNDVRSDLTDTEEIKALDQEIESLQSLRNDLISTAVGPEIASRNYTTEDIKGAFLTVDPDYQNEIQRIVNQDGPELDKSLDLQLLKRQTREQLAQAVSNNELIIVKSDDGATVADLIAQNDLYGQAIQKLTEEIDDVDQFKAAYETDNKVIIESEEAIIQKLNEQIDLTESYISMLDQVTASTERELDGETDGDRIKALTDMLAALLGEREAAQLKLDTYESDLSLTIATDSEPVTDMNTDDTTTADTTADDTTSDSSTETTTNTTADSTVDTDDSTTTVDESLTPSEQILASLQPIEVRDLDPDYLPEWSTVDGDYTSTIERNTAKIELNNRLVTQIDEAIAERVAALDEIDDPDIKDEVQLDIQQLERTKSDKLAINENLASRIAEFEGLDSTSDTTVDSVTDDSTTDSTTEDIVADDKPTEMTDELAEEFIEVFQRPKNIDPTEIYESGLLSDMLADNEDPELEINNRSEIYTLQQEVAVMEADLIGAPESKRKKLDKQIEKKYQKLADEEIANAPRIERLSEIRYDENMEKISALSAGASEVVSQNDWLMAEVQHLMNKAQSEKDEAASTRKIAAPEIDEIKQNYLFREAFLFDQNAIEYQEKVIAIYENAELLASQDEEYLAALKAGELPGDENLADTEKTELDVEAFVGRDNVSASGFNRSEPIENRTVAIADVINRTRMREIIAAEHDISEEQLTKLENEPQLASYFSGVNDLGTLESERAVLINERNAISAEALTIEQRIKLLNKALESAEDETERAGLEAELETVIASAQVLYQQIDDKEFEIHQKTQKVIDLSERLQTAYAEIDLDGLVTEIAEEDLAIVDDATDTTTDDTTADETTTDDSTTDDLTSVDPTESADDTSADLDAAARSETTSVPAGDGGFVMPSSPRDFINFENPEFLNEEIFVRMDEAAYSESNPIPVDVTMPRGVVYKVQVGAFRNPIPQDHFSEFAPMAAEQLNNGITRYTAGLFPSFEGADDAKVDIRGMGYSDAFVVAFRDGVRISLSYAKLATGEELIASNDGPATPITTTTPTTTTSGTTTDESSTTTSNPSASGTTTSADEVVDAETAADYYDSFEDAADATQVEALSGLFYTVQVGVYSKPVPASDLYHISPLNSEMMDNGRIRYSSGRYNSLIDASVRKEEIRATGITDAFVTVYYNGKRIGVSAASEVLQNEGLDELEVTNTLKDSAPAAPSTTYDLYIGSFEDEVPANAAKAMLFLEQQWGVFQIESGSRTIYFTGRISTPEQAKEAAADFEVYGVEGIRIRAFKNDVEVPFED